MDRATVGIAIALSAAAAAAQPVEVKVSIESLAPQNGVAATPFALGFHDGGWDPFDAGAPASDGLRLLAETGDASGYLGDFAADQPGGVSGVVTADMGGFGPGVFIPGSSGSMTFTLDPADNRYLSYASMAVPSNDRFFGNEHGVELFDAGGSFVGGGFVLYGRDIWDAGTEVDGLFGAAFVVGQNAGDHTPQNGVIALNHDFGVYAGASTPAGYDFSALPGADDALVRFSFEVVPAPGAAALFGAAGLLATRRRR